MTKLTITKIYRNTKDKNGNPLITKNNKPYERVSIKTQEYGDKYLSAFGGQWNAGWDIGSVIDVDVEKNGDFLNIKQPDRFAAMEKRIAELEEWQTEVNDFFLNQPDSKLRRIKKEGGQKVNVPPIYHAPPDEYDKDMPAVEDIPF